MNEKKQYTLLGADGKPYLSDEKGAMAAGEVWAG